MYAINFTLDQLQAFVAVVDRGSYAEAATALNKGQSSVSYAVQNLEQALGLAVFAIQGRKAVLTGAGEILLPQARHILETSASLNRQASALGQGVEPVLRVAIEAIVPRRLVIAALSSVSGQYPGTRIELQESVLSGTHEALLENTAELILTGTVPAGHVGEAVGQIQFRCLTAPGHPLQKLQRAASLNDLREHRQIVVRDSGSHRRLNAPWLEAGKRWTVSTLDTSLQILRDGLGFAWFPLSLAQEAVERGELTPLQMDGPGLRSVNLFIVYRDHACAGPACRAFGEQMSKLIHNQGMRYGISPAQQA